MVRYSVYSTCYKCMNRSFPQGRMKTSMGASAARAMKRYQTGVVDSEGLLRRYPMVALDSRPSSPPAFTRSCAARRIGGAKDVPVSR
jgi:hypothetical protein